MCEKGERQSGTAEVGVVWCMHSCRIELHYSRCKRLVCSRVDTKHSAAAKIGASLQGQQLQAGCVAAGARPAAGEE